MKVNKRKVITKILSYMLVMAMMIGLMPGGMAKAADPPFVEGTTIKQNDKVNVESSDVKIKHYVSGSTITDTKSDIPIGEYELTVTTQLGSSYFGFFKGSDIYHVAKQTDNNQNAVQVSKENDCYVFTATHVDASQGVPITSIKLDKHTVYVNEGDVVKITATIVPENADPKVVRWGTEGRVGVAKIYTNPECTDEIDLDAPTSVLTVYYKIMNPVQEGGGDHIYVDNNVLGTGNICDRCQMFPKNSDDDTSTDKKEEFKPADNVPSSEVEGLDDALLDGVLTDDEKTAVAAGQKATLTLEMTNIDGSVNAEDKTLTEKAAQSVNKNAQIGTYFDLSLLLTVGNSSRKVNNTGSKDLKFKLKVPEKYHAPKGVIRTFFIIRIHASKSDILAKTTSTTIPFSSSDFSTYALAYVDEPIKGFYPGLKISQKDGKIKVSWEKVEGAAKYAVFITYCGKDMPKKANTKVKTNKVTIKKIGGKKINFSKNMKMYVVAYDSNGNTIGKSVSAHFAGKDSKKYKNPKDIKLSTKNVSINVGGTANIKASVKMESGKKKALSTGHAAKLRYASSDISIATVDKSGKVTGVGAGTCTVYVYAQNGLAKKVAVTVN